MTVRVEVVTQCEICVANAEYSPAIFPTTHEIRRSFTEWPPEAIEAGGRVLCTDEAHAYNPPTDPDWIGPCVGHYREAEGVLAAALGHITGDNK